jgi:hypothetical protein
MKYNLLYTVFLIFAISPNVLSQNIRTLFKNEIVYGKVQMITGSETITSLTNGTTTIPVKDTTYFDEKGNTTARHIRIVDSYIYKYITTFDTAGNKLETICDTGLKKQIFKYDKSGNLIGMFQVSKTEKLYCSVRFKYDDSHNLLETEDYLPSGQCTLKRCFRYDDKGFIDEENDYWNKDKLPQVLLYSYSNYDEKGNWTHLEIAEKLPQGKPKSIRVTNRQITYYQ